ncbi:patatin-like phospholipase family protein [Desulfobacterales bacterium HSG17]|nr:patatin-like phospholipase family protein [Desulfobacterales bacterium HSG17]
MSGIGLCLSSGGAKGYVHIGVIETMIERGIDIEQITGTSIGALIGGIYAYTGDIQPLKKLALGITKKKWYLTALKDFNPFGQGLLTGKHIMKLFSDLIPKDAQIEDCKIPFSCIAVDILTGMETVFESGSLIDAIRASISLPLTFHPVKRGQDRLVDGTCINPAPVDELDDDLSKVLVATCRSHGMKILPKYSKAGVMHTYMLNSTAQLTRLASREADHTLWSHADNIDTLDFWKAEEGIAEGRRMMEYVGEVINI